MGILMDLRALEDFERKLAAFYEWLSEAYVGDPEASALFYRLQSEEKAHANLLQYQRRLCQKNPALFKNLEIGTFDAASALLRLEQLSATGRPPGLRDAVCAAVEVEQSAAEKHSRQALRLVSGEVSGVLKTLSEADQSHARGLIELGRKRGYLDAGCSERPMVVAGRGRRKP